MIYQPRVHGVFVYERCHQVVVRCNDGCIVEWAVVLTIQVRSNHKVTVVAKWDERVEPRYRWPIVDHGVHQYRGGVINVN